VILPSLLLCDFANLQSEIRALEQAGVQALHLDVMDGVFVDNFTYGLPIVEAVNKVTDLPLDVHLMVAEPIKFIEEFRDAGADLITFQVEATDRIGETIDAIKSVGAAAGVALNPETPVESIEQYLPECDLVLVMSVKAGFGGQAFQSSVLQKLKQIRQVAGQEVVLEIDGGINKNTIEQSAESGAELFVVGSGIFRESDYAAAVANLQSLAGTRVPD
jgi:ribulose-phosphate 3-epimerase